MKKRCNDCEYGLNFNCMIKKSGNIDSNICGDCIDKRMNKEPDNFKPWRTENAII